MFRQYIMECASVATAEALAWESPMPSPSVLLYPLVLMVTLVGAEGMDCGGVTVLESNSALTPCPCRLNALT